MIKPTNIVYMGMGEPFLNYREVVKSLLIITDKNGFGISSKRITISTIGLKGKIKKFTEDIIKPENKNLRNLKIALSLHSTDNELRKSAIGVFPSHQEGMPLALLEMMATGLPVVASNIPEIATIITDGYDGLLFEVGNVDDLAEKLQRVLSDETLRKKLGENARKTVLEKYATPLSKSYGEFYKNLVKTKI